MLLPPHSYEVIMVANIMPAIAALLLGAGSGGSVRQDGIIVSTVAKSEWTPAGEVRLDLRTGRYDLRHAPSRLAPQAPVRITRGRLGSSELRPLRDAAAAARAEGLIHQACRDGGPPPQIVISNGGPEYLALSRSGERLEAHRDLGCWTEAAQYLEQLLEATFGHRARPPGR
jgi:hypothetical protein